MNKKIITLHSRTAPTTITWLLSGTLCVCFGQNWLVRKSFKTCVDNDETKRTARGFRIWEALNRIKGIATIFVSREVRCMNHLKWSRQHCDWTRWATSERRVFKKLKKLQKRGKVLGGKQNNNKRLPNIFCKPKWTLDECTAVHSRTLRLF